MANSDSQISKKINQAGQRATVHLKKCFAIATNELSRLTAELSSLTAKTKAINMDLTMQKKSLVESTRQYALQSNALARLQCVRENVLTALRDQQKQTKDSNIRIKHLEMEVASALTWKLRFNEAESRRALLELQLSKLREGVRSLVAGEMTTSSTTRDAVNAQHVHQNIGKDDVAAKTTPSLEPSPHDHNIATIIGMGFKLPRLVLIEILESVDGDLQSALSEIQNRVASDIFQCQKSGEDFSPSIFLQPRSHSCVDSKPTHNMSMTAISAEVSEDEDESHDFYDFDSVDEEEDSHLRKFRKNMVGW